MSISTSLALQSYHTIRPWTGSVPSFLVQRKNTVSFFIGGRNIVSLKPQNKNHLYRGHIICSITEQKVSHFQPGISGDGFLNSDSFNSDSFTQVIDVAMQQHIDFLKQKVRRELFASDYWHELKFIDEIKRLGISYHFKKEIKAGLERMHVEYDDHADLDLLNASLRFRILREHGYNVSSDIFLKFKDTIGNFKECLSRDVLGLLSFYEASHLMVHGEKILEEALVFTTMHLEIAVRNKSYPLVAKISQALERPLRKGLEILCARQYMPIYEDTTSHSEELLELAKLDFNMLQSLHQKELSWIIRWWNKMEIEKKFPLTKHRSVEIFFATTVTYFEPQYSLARRISPKLLCLATTLDDMFDASGSTFEELNMFAIAIHSWDANHCLDGLPQALQLYYHTLLDVMNEIEEELEKEGLAYQVTYAKQVFKDQARDYLIEAQWLHEGHIPSMEEYMPVRSRSVGACLTILLALIGNNNVTKETFEWILKYPKIVRAASLHFRLLDDLGANGFEKQKGDGASIIDCYIDQYGVSEQEAVDVFKKQVADSWKDINEEFLIKPAGAPMFVLIGILNFTRSIDLVYKEDDGFTRVGKVVKDGVKTVFVDPVLVS